MTEPTRRTAQQLTEAAHRIADEVLFPLALEADQAGTVPLEQLQVLAEAGFYAISTYCDGPTIAQVMEILAGGCLTTAFVFAQHMGATGAAWRTTGPVHDEFAIRLARGNLHGGVAFAHLLRAGPPMTTATPTVDGWRLNGTAPWVTGWGHIDLLHVASRHGDTIVWALIDATDSASLTSEQIRFATVDSTQTDVLTFVDHIVPATRVTAVDNYDEWKAKYSLGLRNNGSLALGVASRCCRLLESPALDAELDRVRDAMNNANADEMAQARSAASLFAVRAATALVASTGGRAVMMSEHAQRLMREAMFTLVQGQTPEIKSHMLDALRPTLAES